MPALAGADGDASRSRPRFQRDGEKRPKVRKPPHVLLPDALRLGIVERNSPVAGADDETAGVVPERKVRSRPPAHGRGNARPLPITVPDPAALAIPEADRMAREMSRTLGRRQYYRIGFHQGVRVAADDESLGMWDYLQGIRLGRSDPEARSLGVRAGMNAADESAREDARIQVEAEFMDLSREPGRYPRYTPPQYDPVSRWIDAPELFDIFREIRIDQLPGRVRRTLEAFEGWRDDPWKLYRCDTYTAFYEERWRDGEYAFARFLSLPGRSRVYRRLPGDAARLEFERVFKSEFVRRLPRYFDAYLLPAHQHGYEDGWNLGASVRYEYSFRLGYSEGFDRAAAAEARAGFRAAYAAALDRYWNREFSDWSTSVVPGILNVTVTDADDDGVLRPGETALIAYELANYGGGSGDLALRLEGRYLERPLESTIRFRGRGVQRSRESLRAGILPTTPPRTRALLTMRVGDRTERIHALVSNPLEFTGRVTLDRIDTLGGSAILIVRATNTSRGIVGASIDLTGLSAYATTQTGALGFLGPGETAAASFEISSIRPLDMLSGELTASLLVRDGEDVQDSLEFSFPDLACNLDNRDLLRVMGAMSRDAGTTAADIARVRTLVLRRMRADWRVAVRGRGNPYKHDLRNGTAGTSLGDLVSMYRSERSMALRPEVFDRLGEEIAILADELPGTHPFLRKSMKKLARRVG